MTHDQSDTKFWFNGEYEPLDMETVHEKLDQHSLHCIFDSKISTYAIGDSSTINISTTIEGVPDIEMTMSKVLDGYPLLYHLATNEASETAIDCAAFGSKRDFVPGWIMVDADNFSEDVTMVGNNKRWKAKGGGK